MNGASDYGKGDQPRPFSRKKWDEGWERIWGKPPVPDCEHLHCHLVENSSEYAILCSDCEEILIICEKGPPDG